MESRVAERRSATKRRREKVRALPALRYVDNHPAIDIIKKECIGENCYGFVKAMQGMRFGR
jgi:hypothetical protein